MLKLNFRREILARLENNEPPNELKKRQDFASVSSGYLDKCPFV